MRMRAKHLGIPVDVPPVGLDQPGVIYVIYSRDPANDRMYVGITHKRVTLSFHN